MSNECMSLPPLKSCDCDKFVPFSYKTVFLGIIEWHTVMCVGCGKKVRGLTLSGTIEKWNRRAGESNE